MGVRLHRHSTTAVQRFDEYPQCLRQCEAELGVFFTQTLTFRYGLREFSF